ncbi:MAG: hypothetical protein PHE50_06965, partial [Dehalococcoidales bacterium]|nr:hypothetical protein [Dehalococcoidales bacterium]
ELHVRTMDEVMQACGVVYKALKIDFRGSAGGQITIGSCFFSSFYTAHVCSIISSLDEGLIAGLSGGSRLEFEQRITEGKPCCKARLLPQERPA